VLRLIFTCALLAVLVASPNLADSHKKMGRAGSPGVADRPFPGAETLPAYPPPAPHLPQ
jgi:hypothetical protein